MIDCGQFKPANRPPPEIIVFNDPSKRKKPLSNASSHEKKQQKDVREILSTADTSFNLDKARYEVRQLGIKGMSNESKEDAVLNKLIQLGAKPPKRKYTNYKELQEVRKKEKVEKADIIKRKKQMFRQQNNSSSTRLSGVKKRKKKSANIGRGVDGQIGRYVRGVQVIDSKDLRRVQSKIASNSRD